MNINLPTEKIRQGFYSDVYFWRAKRILEQDNHHPIITMQVFQKHGQVIICGIEEIKQIFQQATGYDSLKISSLQEGDSARAMETVMLIEGDYSLFAHLETLFLGILARRTMVATNMRQLVTASQGKPVLFFAPRFDYFLNQEGDGYAAHVGGAAGVSTDAAASWFDGRGIGTIPHALIVAYQGNITQTVAKFNQFYPQVNAISLVDFHNDCVQGALDSARKLGKKLWGVRLDTAADVADVSTPNQTGVNPQLVKKVRQALDKHGFTHVKIIVSGGFNPRKISLFEKLKTPADIYAVGSFVVSGQIDFTADAVRLNGKNLAKTGRRFSPNPRLKPW